LDGLHRLLAGKDYLDKNDQWWIVRLYSKEEYATCTPSNRSRSIETFKHEQPYTDGFIFRKIRLYHREGDEEGENRWWARLTKRKRANLKQLLRNRALRNGFDALLDFPGHWTPIQLGMLNRLHSLKCPEELVEYLQHTADIWDQILHSKIPKSAVDTLTVQNLELCAPGLSEKDQDYVIDLMNMRKIFPTVSDPGLRASLLEAILSVNGIIPSLRTFFENQKYLEPCTLILKRLLGDSDKLSLRAGFFANYFDPQAYSMQCGETTMERIRTSPDNARALAYIQLWMFCLRHFPEMTSLTPKKKVGCVKKSRAYNPALWSLLGTLAVSLGFKTDAALELDRQNPDKEYATHFLRTARPNWEGDFRDPVSKIVQVLHDMRETRLAPQRPIFTSEGGTPRDRRCGKPYDSDHDKDKTFLYTRLLFEPPQRGSDITSLYVKRDIFGVFLRRHIQVGKISSVYPYYLALIL
ncbi:hypothetical protein GQ43DRAFT_494755, partial [Delitschia confertaspora ATCC 74209]